MKSVEAILLFLIVYIITTCTNGVRSWSPPYSSVVLLGSRSINSGSPPTALLFGTIKGNDGLSRRRRASVDVTSSSSRDDANNYDDDNDNDNESDDMSDDDTAVNQEGTLEQPSSLQEEQSTDPTGQDTNLQQTIRGGPSMIFAMARRMLVWDDEDYQAGRVLNDASSNKSTPRGGGTKVKVLPRWHPHDGIADANPNFRTQSPVMNNKGYGATIQRNSRKNNKPGLWRHAYRTYVKMRDIELDQQLQQQQQQQREILETSSSSSSSSSGSSSSSTTNNITRSRRYPSKIKIKRENRHFQAALVACAKLGLWKEAIFILREMEEMQEKDPSSSTTTNYQKHGIIIDEYIIMSVIKACIRGMKQYRSKKDGHRYSNSNYGQQESSSRDREPLDTARDILLSMTQNQRRYNNMPPSPMLVNPLSSAYQYMGLHLDAEKVLDLLQMPSVQTKEGQERNLMVNTAATFLTQGSKDQSEIVPTNESSIYYKDEASYNILVKNSVLQGNWASAIHDLQEMTNAGYYPKSKSLNGWSEAAMKRERRPKKPTWIKQRERILMRNAHPQ
mmetsp:Transcript_3730/g.7133  ORF Transcript_3730/g.7133 Transcript_3730/m.7133 type:complete len:560 (-) Transcript_3730:86-1765(-)|eukprot:CAMPEP_0176497248 /NCGR_PEP_ID=MMETSP0200_2-20121128/11620_1 /TAXON_ID=947934 /ORGANISM="Chaetoceros sp., Strain GSL56" /LENGTH=559 /DNA_ID=CAMNT_0017895243 /DNA_START=38 /DNA_END=1717 /DNA_ORIENTATION=+